MPAAWRARLSRRANGALGGEPDLMLCAELHRRASWLCPLIDAAMLVLRGERGHCRAMSDYERARRSVGDPVARARAAGL